MTLPTLPEFVIGREGYFKRRVRSAIRGVPIAGTETAYDEARCDVTYSPPLAFRASALGRMRRIV
jgi:hypothetical protein